MKRVVYEVRWVGPPACWRIFRGGKSWLSASTKALAMSVGAVTARQHWDELGQPTELIVKNKNGSIGKGRGSRRSYGKDPKRSKG